MYPVRISDIYFISSLFDFDFTRNVPTEILQNLQTKAAALKFLHNKPQDIEKYITAKANIMQVD